MMPSGEPSESLAVVQARVPGESSARTDGQSIPDHLGFGDAGGKLTRTDAAAAAMEAQLLRRVCPLSYRHRGRDERRWGHGAPARLPAPEARRLNWEKVIFTVILWAIDRGCFGKSGVLDGWLRDLPRPAVVGC